MITIGIDPGLVTGIAVYHSETNKPIVHEIHGRETVYRWFDSITPTGNMAPSVEVVIEDYEITQRTGALSKQYDALYIVGAIEAMCFLKEIPFFHQHRSAKAFGSDAKLKFLGWYAPSRGGHQNDAMRHLLRHLIVTRRDAELLDKIKEML